jgi:hypothetical protein
MNYIEDVIVNIRKQWGFQIKKNVWSFNDVHVMQIPESLIGAMIYQESKGDKLAKRFEKAYYDALVRGGKCYPDELLNGSHSHGILQIMGAHSNQFAYCGDLKTKNGNKIITCGTLKYSIRDFYCNPVEVALQFMYQEASKYLRDRDWSAVLHIYNGGTPDAVWSDEYTRNVLNIKQVYETSIKSNPSLELENA